MSIKITEVCFIKYIKILIIFCALIQTLLSMHNFFVLREKWVFDVLTYRKAFVKSLNSRSKSAHSKKYILRVKFIWNKNRACFSPALVLF